MSESRLSSRARGTACALAAALLFGASAPLAKLLLPSVAPLMLAAIFYLGAGGVLFAARALRGAGAAGREAPLTRADAPLLAAVTLAGGIAGPVLMLLGLERVTGVVGALLLNLEAPFTILLALAFFGEHLGRREVASAALVIAGAALLGARSGPVSVDVIGIAAIAGACLCWGLDNNWTQRLSLRDPIELVSLKATSAGACMLGVALATGHSLPGAKLLAMALAVGSLSYGAGIVLAVYALRELGAARESALFATAPFAGALLAIPLLGELPRAVDCAAAGVMALGVALLVRASHDHLHAHGALEHEHSHFHDEHHRHAHEGPVEEPHSHAHRHEPLVHRHPHVSDLHHRHGHE
jgi:drug/metabolite transporter (DMT)-like permease